MVSQPVLSEQTLKSLLEARGCAATTLSTETGTIWKTAQGLHFIVPFPEQGYYPDWMLMDVERMVGRINAWSARNRRQ